MVKYISKGDWFDEGTEAILICDYRLEKGFENFPIGLFRGWKTCDNSLSENRPLGERYEDEEDCGFDEFDIIEE